MTEASLHHQTADQIANEDLLIRAAQRNPRDFEPLYVKYYERIASYLHHRLENKELAFEITAEVFYTALSNIKKYKPQGLPFSAWLFRIASNQLNQWFRKNKTQRIVSIDTQGLSELKDNIEENKNADTDKQLFDAMQNLDEEEMELITMRFFEKRSFKEISDFYEIGESACKMRLYRILEKLKEKLSNRIHVV